jgi:hypothetical protein
MTCECSERQAIIDVLNAYATCLDARDWLGLNDVFHPQAVGIYGATHNGRSAIIESIRSFLGGCGPSQHLLGNYQVAIDGDEARSATKARVLHIGADERADLTPYEAIGVYRDRHLRTADGWRIIHRHFDVQITLGDINVLHRA